MRRYLILFSCLVFCLSLFCIPAFASELQTYEAVIDDGTGGFGTRIAPGTYIVTLTIDGESMPLDDNMLVVTGEEDTYYEFHFTIDGDAHTLRITLSGNYSWCEYLLDDMQVVGSVGLCRVAPPGLPEPPAPSGNFLEDVGSFFSFAISSIAGALGVVLSSPPLSILCIAFPIVGFAVALLSRMKAL